MEFAFIIYLVSMINNLGTAFAAFTLVSVGTLAFHCGDLGQSHNKSFTTHFKKKFLIIPIVLSLITSIIPTEKTMYLMLAGYASQAAVQSSIGQDVIQILELKVKEQLKELQPKTKE